MRAAPEALEPLSGPGDWRAELRVVASLVVERADDAAVPL